MTPQKTITDTFSYNPETGDLQWKIPQGRLPAGHPAGTRLKNGVINVRFRGTWIAAHRIVWHIMTGEWPKMVVRHKNGDRSDNRWANLEIRAPKRERDPFTRKPIYHDTSHMLAHGITPVIFNSFGVTVYEAAALNGGKRIYLGRFRTKEEARDAFTKATAQTFCPGYAED